MIGMMRKTTARTTFALVALLIAGSLAGCAARQSAGGEATSSSGRSGYDIGAPSAVAPSPATDGLSTPEDASKGGIGAGTGTSSGTTVEKLIVLNKSVRLEVKSADDTIAKIRDLASAAGGDVSSLQVSTSTDQPIYPVPIDAKQYASGGPEASVPLKAYVTVRVPSAGYKAFVADVMKLGTVLYQYESAEDVTQQHVDMKARLDNMKAEEARLRQLFAKATRVSDMLAIEQELTRVQGEIESMQAQITYLENQAALATVTIELKEPTPVVSPSGIDWGTRTAFTDAVRAFVNTMNGLIVLLGPVLALLVFVGLPALLVVWLVRRAIRKRRAAKTAPPAASSSDEPTDRESSER